MIINIRIVLFGAITTIIYFWQIFCQWIAYNEPNDDDKNRTTKQKNRYCLSKKKCNEKAKEEKNFNFFFSLLLLLAITMVQYDDDNGHHDHQILIDWPIFLYIIPHTYTHTKRTLQKPIVVVVCVRWTNR